MIATFLTTFSAFFFLTFGTEPQEGLNEAKPSPTLKTTTINLLINSDNMEIATFGTGCFWCTEAIFESLEGVSAAVSGYSGGHVDNPTYEAVCDKTTGHAEVVQITFDPTVITFENLLEVFWETHDPTTLNRQGNDIGPQYRSVIFYHNERQQFAAEKAKKEADASSQWSNPIVTEISPYINFYKAESEHQGFYERVGNRNPYCSIVISPKMEKFRKTFKEKLKKDK